MYELLFSSQQPKAKEFRKHYCDVLFPHIQQQLTNKRKEDHQQAIEEKDAVIDLMNDALQDRDNQIQDIKYENVALQAERAYIRPSYKNAKTSSSILGHVM